MKCPLRTWPNSSSTEIWCQSLGICCLSSAEQHQGQKQDAGVKRQECENQFELLPRAWSFYSWSCRETHDVGLHTLRRECCSRDKLFFSRGFCTALTSCICKPACSELDILLPSCCCCTPTDNLENNWGISSSLCYVWGSCVLETSAVSWACLILCCIMILQQRDGIHSEFLVVLFQISFACKFRQAVAVLDAKVLCATADLCYNKQQGCPVLPAQAHLKGRNQVWVCQYLPSSPQVIKQMWLLATK